jgi:hypothetical protein
MSPVYADVDQTGGSELAELQGHGAKADVWHGPVDVSGSQFLSPDQPQDLAPAR